MVETITEKTARLKALREARDGTPEQRRARQKFQDRIKKAGQRAKQEYLLRVATAKFVRQIEAETGAPAPKTVQNFIKGR